MSTQLSNLLDTCAPDAFDDEIERQRLRVFKATMTTVQHIVNNALNNLQLVRLEARDNSPKRSWHCSIK
jgi:hypothetical protein